MCVQDWLPDGWGVLTFPCGSEYRGEFASGQFNNKGVLITAKGMQYEGQWKEGHFEGQGTLKHADGAT